MTTAKDPVAEAVHLLDALGWPEVRRPLLAEIERLRAIEAALDADASPTDPCVLCGSKGPVSLVASRRGSFWLCEDAATCRARKGGAK
jgi:hypothetical protein